MGRMRWLLFVFFMLQPCFLFADWQSMDWVGRRIIGVSVSEKGVYVLSDRFVYRLVQGAAKKISRVRGGEDLVLGDIDVGDNFVYWASNIGLFRAPTTGGRAERIFYPDGGVTCLDVYGEAVFVGGEKAVYGIVDGRPKLLFRARNVSSVKFLPGRDTLLVLSRDGLMFWKMSEGRKLKVISFPEGEDFNPLPHSIAFFKEKVYVLRRSSVFEVENRNLKLVFDYPGNVNGLLVSEERLLCYGDNGIYDVFSKDRLNNGLESLDITSGSHWRGITIVSIPYQIYRWQDRRFEKFKNGSVREKFLWQVFSWEPSVLELQRKAMQYANVSPDKIYDWRRRLRKRAILPKFKIDVDWDGSRSVSDSVSVSAYGAENVGPDDKTVYKSSGVGFSLEWDFKDLIWSDEEISIDTRSKLTVELRDDILDQINQLYFERRRLVTKFILNPPKDRGELLALFNRVEHLRADLDGLTGGYLTEALAKVGHEDWEKRWLLTLMEEVNE